MAEATRVMGEFLRDVMKRNADSEISASWVRTKRLRTGSARSSK